MENPVSIEKESLMITNDFNSINVDFYVEYMVTDPIRAVRHRNVYESIIKNLAQSYIRDTVGLYNVDDVITTGKTQIQERVKEQLTNRLVEENIGYGIYNVSIQDSECPGRTYPMHLKPWRMPSREWRRPLIRRKNTSRKTSPRPMQRPISSYRRRRPISSRGSTRPTDRWHVLRIHTLSM